MKIYQYTIKLSKDWNPQINHNVVTNLIEKGSNIFFVKSKGLEREMIIISNKNIDLFEVKNDLGFGLKIKIIQKKEVDFVNFNQKIKISGTLSYSFVSSKDNKNYCPIDIKTNKIIFKEKLDEFLSKNLGISVESIIVKGLPKNIISEKIIIYDQFHIEVIGYQNNNETFKKLQYNAIGKRKSYGLGFMEIQNYENSI